MSLIDAAPPYQLPGPTLDGRRGEQYITNSKYNRKEIYVSEGEPDLDRIFMALADATRRQILLTLRERPASVGELVARSHLSQPAVSKHLKVLESAGLLRRERDGQRIYSVIEFAPLIRAAVFVSLFEQRVEENLDRLDDLLSEDSSDAPAPADASARSDASVRSDPPGADPTPPKEH